MTNLLTIPHDVGRIIVEDGAMLFCLLLGTNRFLKFCGERGLTINRERLFRLERLGVFSPVFRVRTPQESTDPFHIPIHKNNNWFSKGWAEDTTAAPRNHAVPAHTDQACEGYYSVFQVDHLHFVLSCLTVHLQLDSYLERSADQPTDWQKQGEQKRQLAEETCMALRDCQHRRALALLCQHISNRYFPQTQTDMRTMKTGYGSFWDAWITVGFSPGWNWYQDAQQWDPKRIQDTP